MKREGGEGDCTKERLRNEPLSDEFARAWALQNGIAEWILLAIPLCNADRFRPRTHDLGHSRGVGA